MECRKVEEQRDECEIHVVIVGASSFYENLRFALLASSWLPLPPGILIWSALHLVLVFLVTLLFVAVFIFLVCTDIFVGVTLVVIYLIYGAVWDIAILIIDTLRWFFLMMRIIISCQATPGKAAKVAYERIAGIRVLFFARMFLKCNKGTQGTERKWIFPMFSVWMVESCLRVAGPEPGAPVEAGEEGPEPGAPVEAGEAGPEPGELAEAVEVGPEPGELAEAGEAGPEPGELAEAGEAGPEPGELAEAVEVGPEPGELAEVGEAECCGECPFSRSRMKRWCEEIVPRYDVVRV